MELQDREEVSVLKVRVKDPKTEEMVDGEIIEIVEAKEPLSYVTLKDGTIITSKMSVNQVIRLVDRWDDEGKPVYSIAVSASTTINSLGHRGKDAGDE